MVDYTGTGSKHSKMVNASIVDGKAAMRVDLGRKRSGIWFVGSFENGLPRGAGRTDLWQAGHFRAVEQENTF